MFQGYTTQFQAALFAPHRFDALPFIELDECPDTSVLCVALVALLCSLVSVGCLTSCCSIAAPYPLHLLQKHPIHSRLCLTRLHFLCVSGRQVFAAAFGRNKADVEAYRTAFVRPSHVFIVDESTGVIHSVGSREHFPSYYKMMPHLRRLFDGRRYREVRLITPFDLRRSTSVGGRRPFWFSCTGHEYDPRPQPGSVC